MTATLSRSGLPTSASVPGLPTDFAQVYDDQVWRVYGFILYRVRNRELAEDLTQTTFERALRAWPRFDPRKASEATWLIAIARNIVIDHFRRGHSAPTAEIDDKALGHAPGPEEAFSGHAGLEVALGELSERDREIVELRFAGDLTGPEIAEATGLSLANVQQILSRSLRKLREALSEDDPARLPRSS